jgi:hypothetical protein
VLETRHGRDALADVRRPARVERDAKDCARPIMM